MSEHVDAWHWPLEHTSLEQSDPAAHVCPSEHTAHCGPPQSTSVSFAFFTMSEHVGRHVEPEQLPPTQSLSCPQPSPGPHGPHDEPPQSASVSVPFCTVSEHVGAWHTPPVHTSLWQSALAAHFFASAHGAQSAPPQSVSVSAPFFTASAHVGATHWLIMQTWLAQSEAPRHSTHCPAPSQSLPGPPSLHASPATTGAFEGLPASHVSTVHGF
jgi:hypothetical protein